MKHKIAGYFLFLFGLLFGLIGYNALFVVHYDLDPVSVLASLLGLRISVLGIFSFIVCLLFFVFGTRIVRRGSAAPEPDR